MADLIEELSGLDDNALSAKLGMADKLKEFKSNLARASKLEGKARAKVVAHLTRTFTPHTYEIEDLSWQIDRAEGKDKCGPAQLVADCGCMDEED